MELMNINLDPFLPYIAVLVTFGLPIGAAAFGIWLAPQSWPRLPVAPVGFCTLWRRLRL
jgi:hypothetical protein